MMDNPIRDKSFLFAVSVINVCRHIMETRRDYVVSKQLLRSGTAIGALYREAEFGESKRDFVHKLHIALKEANEAKYWLELMAETDLIDKDNYISLLEQCEELIRLLVSIIKSSKISNQ